MKINIYMIACIIILLKLVGCGKGSDHYFKEFLDKAELAKPGAVDSLEILPGKNRAIVRFLVSPDRRIDHVNITYSTSLSSATQEIQLNISEQDYGSFKEVVILDLPEATLNARVTSWIETKDGSNTVEASVPIYGTRYSSALGNRIFSELITTPEDVKQIYFRQEAGLPQKDDIFTNIQRTEIVYPSESPDSLTQSISPYQLFAELPGISDAGTLKFRTIYKPVENAIDEFAGQWRYIAY